MITTGLIPHDDGLAKYAATLFEKLSLLRHTDQLPLQSGQLLFMWLAPCLPPEKTRPDRPKRAHPFF